MKVCKYSACEGIREYHAQAAGPQTGLRVEPHPTHALARGMYYALWDNSDERLVPDDFIQLGCYTVFFTVATCAGWVVSGGGTAITKVVDEIGILVTPMHLIAGHDSTPWNYYNPPCGRNSMLCCRLDGSSSRPQAAETAMVGFISEAALSPTLLGTGLGIE